MMKLLLLFLLLLSAPHFIFSQNVREENLTERVRLYWDIEKKHIRARGAYYTDQIIGETQEKHGKWWFYDAKGNLTEEQHFFRDRIHGAQLHKVFMKWEAPLEYGFIITMMAHLNHEKEFQMIPSI